MFLDKNKTISSTVINTNNKKKLLKEHYSFNSFLYTEKTLVISKRLTQLYNQAPE